MTRFLARRLPMAALAMWGVATLVFMMMKAIPGDEARVAAGRTATPEQVAQARERLGLDHSVVTQYLDYLERLLHGDLGTSVVTFQSVADDLARVLPATVELVAATMAVNLLIGVPLGVLAAVRHGKPADGAARTVMVVAGGVPVFWLALLLQNLFAARLGWFPISGRHNLGVEPPEVTGAATVDALLAGDPTAFGDAVAHLVLPALALAAPFVAVVARTVRSSLLGALAADHVTFARAKGAGTGRVVLRHGLRCCLGPIVTIIGMQFGWMMGAALLVESVFGLPGLGTYLTTAVTSQDNTAVLGCVLVLGLVFVVANLLVDVVQLWLDPRARAAGAFAGGAA